MYLVLVSFSAINDNPIWERIPTSPMPIVRIHAADSDSCTDFACFVLRFSPHEGALYLDGSIELNVDKDGRVSFFNNHAGGSGGKYCHPCPR